MIVVDGKKRCWACRQEKPPEDFHRDRSRGDGLSARCKDCETRSKKPRPPKPIDDAQRAYARQWRYGLDPADFQALERRQSGVCAICGERPEPSLAVDHCHATRVVRGLLCRTCNSGIGLFRDDLRLLRKAVEYLDSHKGGRK